MALQIASITKDKPELLPLLEQAFHEIYEPAFPDLAERESLKTFKRAINGEFDNLKIVINILGENLEDAEKRVIKGISVGYYFEEQSVGLLAYNAISPKHREAGLGKLMVQSRIETMQQMAKDAGKTLNGVFIECNDPFKVTPAMDSMDPAKRVAIFKKWGARQIPIDYVQPPVSKHDVYSENLLLLNYPVDGKYATKEAVGDFLLANYRDYYGRKVNSTDDSAEDDYFFKKMTRQLAGAEIQNPPAPAVPDYKTGTPKFDFLKSGPTQTGTPKSPSP